MKVLNLRQKVNYRAANALDQAHNLKLGFAEIQAGDGQIVQVQDFVFKIEIQLAIEEPAQVFVDKEIRVVASHIAAQVTLQAAHRLAAAVSPHLSSQGGRGIRLTGERLRNVNEGALVYVILRISPVVVSLFPRVKRTILKRDADDARPGVPLRLIRQRQEEPLVAFDIIPLHIGVIKPKAHINPIGRFPIVVVKALLGFDIVLVAIRPVQINFLAVVGNGVAIIARIAPLGYKIPLLIIAAEEGVEVIIDARRRALARRAYGVIRVPLSLQIVGNDRNFADLLRYLFGIQAAVSIKGVFAESIADAALSLPQTSLRLDLRG